MAWQGKIQTADAKITELEELANNRKREVNLETSSNTYGIVGIDTKRVGAAIEAIDQYIKEIENKIEEIDSEANANIAFKNVAVQEAVKNYIIKVKEYCGNLTSQLRRFGDKLYLAQNTWVQSASQYSETINEDAAAVNQSGIERKTGINGSVIQD